MKNREKYRDEILEQNTRWCSDIVKPNILKPIGFECGETLDCGQCHAIQMLWLDEEYKEPETDWSKVEVDTPVLVSNDGKKWHKEHFARYTDEWVQTWMDGATSWSVESKDLVFCWEYAKLMEE